MNGAWESPDKIKLAVLGSLVSHFKTLILPASLRTGTTIEIIVPILTARNRDQLKSSYIDRFSANPPGTPNEMKLGKFSAICAS